MTFDPRRALELLRIGSGRPDARFREGQMKAIEHVVEGRGRLLVVQKTGWGKSFVCFAYFIATKLLSEQGNGPALLISPLLALMRNQISAAERMGVRAATINLLSGTEKTEITDYFIDNILPSEAEVEAVLDALEAAPRGLSVPELLGCLNISNARVKKTIALLSLESPAISLRPVSPLMNRV